MKTFITHSSKDKWFADRLVGLLQELGADVWYDKIDLYLGDNFMDKIYAGLEESSHLVVILSENSINSNWVKEELQTFYQDFVQGGKARVYPILLEDVWQRAPKFLRKYVYADFRDSGDESLNPSGVAAVEKEFRGLPVFEGAILKCYKAPEGHRLLVSLPQGKSKAEINEIARAELASLRPALAGAQVTITGRTTYTLALMIGAHLGNICKSLRAFDPKGEAEQYVPIFLPS